MKNIYFIITIILLFISCNNKNNVKYPEFINIENIIENNPDSALNILNTIDINPRDQYNYNLYLLYIIESNLLAKKDISRYSEIIDVYNYFYNNKNDYYTGKSAYCYGHILQKNKEYDKAIKFYNIAEIYAINAKNKEFQGRILFSKGELMLDQFLIDDAKVIFEKSNKLFQETGNYKYKIKGFNNLATSYLLKSEYDSALYYFDKSIAIAKKYNDNIELAYAIKDKGVVYYGKKQYKEAIYYLNLAKEIDNVVIKSGKVDLILSKAYLDINILDSARLYANKSLYWVQKANSSDYIMLLTIYSSLSKIEEAAINYKQSLCYHKDYSKYLTKYFDENQTSSVIDAERKYKYEVAQNKISELSLKYLKTQRVLFILLLLMSIITIIYYRKILRKNKLLLLNNEQLSIANNEIFSLTNSLKDLDTTKESLKDYYLHSFSILKRAAALEYFIQDLGDKQSKNLIKKFNEIAYGQDNIDWDVLYKIINTLNDGIFDKIRNQFFQLDESEFRICCLNYSKLNSNEIAAIMQFSVNTVHMKTTYIRKKLGIEKYGNLSDFFNNAIID